MNKTIADLGIIIEFGAITIADLKYTVGRRPSDNKYVVCAYDAGENTSVSMAFDGEDDAIKAFAALIACDEPNLEPRLQAIAEKFAGYIA